MTLKLQFICFMSISLIPENHQKKIPNICKRVTYIRRDRDRLTASQMLFILKGVADVLHGKHD